MPLAAYLGAIKAHPFVVFAVMLTTLGATAGLHFLKGQSYEATARILVTPLPSDDLSLIGFPLPRAIGDPGRAVETAARLLEGAANTAFERGDVSGPSAGEVSRLKVSVEAQPDSNIVEIVASASSPDRAAEIANVYASAALEARGSQLQSLVRQALSATRVQLEATSDPARVAILDNRLVDLTLLDSGTDPTLSLVQEAAPPRGPTGSPRGVVLAIAAASGFALASVACLLIELLVPRRLRDETDVVRAYPLAVLGRVPRLPVGAASSMADAPAPVVESFRALRTQLAVRPRANRGGAAVAILAGVRDDQSGAVAAGLASAVEKVGETATMIDLDPEDPTLAAGRSRVRDRERSAENSSDSSTPRADSTHAAEPIQVLAAPPPRDLESEERLFIAARDLLPAARESRDWVILRTPPMSERSDVLTIAEACDHILLVSRLGMTPVDSLIAVRELMNAAGLTPAGHVLVDVRRS